MSPAQSAIIAHRGGFYFRQAICAGTGRPRVDSHGVLTLRFRCFLEAPLPAASLDSTTLTFAALIALLAIFAIFRVGSSGRRRKRLAGIAHQLGLTAEGENWSSSSRAPQLDAPLFENGEERKFQNIFSGSHDKITTNFFDYTYRGTGARISQTVAAFTQDVLLPTFEVAPLGGPASKAAGLGIEFDSDPDFSNKFCVRGPSEERIRKFFTRSVLFFLENLDSSSRWRFEGAEFTLIIYRRGETVRPADFPAFVRETTELAKGFLGMDL